MTATLSLAGFQSRLTEVLVMSDAFRPVGADGGASSTVGGGGEGGGGEGGGGAGGGGEVAHSLVLATSEAAGERLPFASWASTSMRYDVSHRRPVTTADGCSASTRGVPSTDTRYPLTRTLSLDAPQESVRLVRRRSATSRPVGAVGAVESGHGRVDTTTDPSGERFPAASTASTAYAVDDPHLIPMSVAIGSFVRTTGAIPRYTAYPTTPMSSVDAFQLRTTASGVVTRCTNPAGEDGAFRSGHAAAEMTVNARRERLPARSKAATPTAVLSPHSSDLTSYVVPSTLVRCASPYTA